MNNSSRQFVFFKNTTANIMLFVFTSLIGLLITPVFVKELGSDLYGIWLLNLAIMNYFLFLDIAISGGVVKHISEARGSGDIFKLTKIINMSIKFVILNFIF